MTPEQLIEKMQGMSKEELLEFSAKLMAALEEAQQTIFKQREALQSIYEESEDKGARHCAADALGIEWEGEKK